MRLWTLHPQYLDPPGLVALWREALLARAVLWGETRGYRHHPQLERFKAHPFPLKAIDAYLAVVQEEATARGYSFDRSKIDHVSTITPIAVASGQVMYEWNHLLEKLSIRKPALYEKWRSLAQPVCHPLFFLEPGPVASWERGK